MLDIGFVLILAAITVGVGLRVVDRLGGRPEHAGDALALALPIGLGGLALATLGLGEIGALGVPGLAVVLAIGAGLGGREIGAVARGRRSGWPRHARSAPDWILGAALLATLLGTLLTALAPVTDGDALCYHLQVPKVFLARHAATFEPDLHETVYPLATEMLYAVALALRGPVACRLVQWVLGVAFAANAAALARPVLGDRAWWAGTIALLVPAVSNGMGAPLNDVALAAFGNAAIVGWMRWRDRPTIGSAALAGMLAGMALGVKYPALVLAGLLGLAMLVAPAEHYHLKLSVSNKKYSVVSRLAHPVAFGAAALAIGGVWYLRAFLHTGNPVFPFFRHTFGGAGIDAVLNPARKAMPVTPVNLLTALAAMTLHPERFDSVSHQFGPVFLLFLPGLVLVRSPRRVWALAALGWAFLTICVTQRQSMRFVLTAVGPMAVAVAWLAAHWWDRRTRPGRWIVGLLMLILVFEATLALARARHGIGVVLGRETAEAYLARREPSYRVGCWVGRHLPPSARVIGQDHRGFYYPRPYTMELAHRRRTGLGTRGESADAIVAHLRARGFTHLLLCPPKPETAVEFDPTLGRKLTPWLARQAPLYREAIADPGGVVRRYAIYDLDGLRTALAPAEGDRR